MRSILSFEFVFALHLMKNILGITNELSIALQKKKKNPQQPTTFTNLKTHPKSNNPIPNHCYPPIQFLKPDPIPKINHKQSKKNKGNRILVRSGRFWQRRVAWSGIDGGKASCLAISRLNSELATLR